MDNLFEVAGRFVPTGRVTGVETFGNGNINDTFLVTVDSAGQGSFVLQRLNTKVFHMPQLVMRNIRISTAHIRRRLERSPLGMDRRWEVPQVLTARDGRDHWIGGDGGFWRAVSLIEGARSFDTVKDLAHAAEVGFALGVFHTLMSDVPPESLSDTLEGFHITPRYLHRFEKVLSRYSGAGSAEVNYCVRSITERSASAAVLEEARARGRLRLRTIHGDPKVNNIMIDEVVPRAVGIVDLDTIKPGLVHYDIGDCLRSGCNPLGEETERWEEVDFEEEICEAILRGYLSKAREFLTGDDFAYIYDAARLIAFELGLRFFTDYLEGNVYFKVNHPEHNLLRALVQLKLVERIESREKTIRAIVGDAR